uniref:Proteasome inhibitor PI31 subunit n=1 Tax=Dendroctonus ponderosae TaxID=77166 RepID=A0AAR5Q777_DENPD
MASSLFGWDLLYGSVAKDIKNNADILVCLTHLALVSNGFKCIGLGESKNIDGSESKSESLPKGWNTEYAIRYVYQGKLYNLKATALDDGIIINLVRVDERTVSLVQLNSRQVSERTGTLDEMIPDNRKIVEQIKKELIDKVVISVKKRDSSCQTNPVSVSSRHSGVEAPRYPYRAPGGPVAGPLPASRVIQDHNPSVGGGMLFQPSRIGPTLPGGPGNLGIAPGSLPPGARFDPFRPPDLLPGPRGGPRRPDNDEFPPPGYDDMYM